MNQWDIGLHYLRSHIYYRGHLFNICRQPSSLIQDSEDLPPGAYFATAVITQLRKRLFVSSRFSIRQPRVNYAGKRVIRVSIGDDFDWDTSLSLTVLPQATETDTDRADTDRADTD